MDEEIIVVLPGVRLRGVVGENTNNGGIP